MRLAVIVSFVSVIPGLALSSTEEAKVKDVAREYIKDHLKAPATAIFSKETVCAPLGKPDVEEAKGTGPTPDCKPQTAAKVGDGADSVIYRGSVDSQNSYGALIRTKFQLHIFFAKDKWTVFDSADYVRSAKQTCIDINQAARTLQDGRFQIRDCDAEFPNAK
jgi:hypothetical protein